MTQISKILFLAVGFVPFLTDVLSRAVPVLPYVRTDPHRYVWAHALRAFCESVREYVSASAVAKTEVDGGSERVIILTCFLHS